FVLCPSPPGRAGCQGRRLWRSRADRYAGAVRGALTPRVLAGLLACALAACNDRGAAPRREAVTPRNVLLLSIASLGADRLGVYGNPRATSPSIDRLGREGVVFERAYSPTSWTLPSHVTLLTGRLPHRHGTITPQDTIAPSEHLLQERFQRAGYETAG